MAYELLSNRNMSEGFEVLFLYVNDITGGAFMKFVVFGFYIIITMSLYYSNKKLTGNGDVPQAMMIGGFATTIFTVLWRLIPGLIDIYTFLIVITLASIGAIWFFTSDE